jgi:hypothetical protein
MGMQLDRKDRSNFLTHGFDTSDTYTHDSGWRSGGKND